MKALSHEFESAVDSEDFVVLRIARARYMVAAATSRLAMSGAYCREVTDDEMVRTLCNSDETVLGGGYGAELREIATGWLAQFFPWTSILSRSGDMEDTDLLDAFARFHGQITSIHDQTAAAVRSLTPPAELQAGHEVIVEYFGGLANVAHAINEAVANRDAEALKAEFARSGEVAAAASENISDELRAIVSPVLDRDSRQQAPSQ